MYKHTNTPSIIRLTDGACIPADPDNNDYAEYLRWVKAGGVTAPADVPSFVTLKATEFAAFRAQRQDFLSRMTWVAADFAGLKTVEGDAASANARAINNALLDMLTHTTIASAADIVALKGAMKTRYKAITSATTATPAGMALPEVVAAFRRVDA